MNGETKQLPAIIVAWDAENQQVYLQFGGGVFKNPEMVKAILQMAMDKMDDERRAAIVRRMQAQEEQKQIDGNLMDLILRSKQ